MEIYGKIMKLPWKLLETLLYILILHSVCVCARVFNLFKRMQRLCLRLFAFNSDSVSSSVEMSAENFAASWLDNPHKAFFWLIHESI